MEARARAAAANNQKKQKTAIREPAAHFIREGGEFNGNIRSEIVENAACGGNDLSGWHGAAHNDGGRGIGLHSALAEIDINDAARGEIQAARSNIADNTNDRERLQVAVHIAERDQLTDWVSIGPTLRANDSLTTATCREFQASSSPNIRPRINGMPMVPKYPSPAMQ
jgi:hypothetical protein